MIFKLDHKEKLRSFVADFASEAAAHLQEKKGASKDWLKRFVSEANVVLAETKEEEK